MVTREIQRELGWACRDRISGKLIALDNASGGYPYLPDRAADVKLWFSSDEAQKYADMFNRSPSYGFELTVERVERVIETLPL